MGMTAAVKLRSIVELAELTTAIELITAAQALEFRAPLSPGRGVKTAYDVVRKHVGPVLTDRPMSSDIETIVAAIQREEFLGL
jgi:histidine ammonia-lyase